MIVLRLRARNRRELLLYLGLKKEGNRAVLETEESSHIERDTSQELWPLVEKCR